MHRLSAMLLVAAAAASTGCQQKKKAADRKDEGAAAPAPSTGAGPLSIDELKALLPETLAGLPRQLVAPEPEIPQLSAYYQDVGNTRSGHVVYTILSDPPRTLEYYQGRYPERAKVGELTLYGRVWQPKSAPETAEGCLIAGERVGVCIDIAPGKVADLDPLFQELPLAEIEKRAARK